MTHRIDRAGSDNPDAADEPTGSRVGAWYRSAAPDTANRTVAIERVMAAVSGTPRSRRRPAWWILVPLAAAAALLLAVAFPRDPSAPTPAVGSQTARSEPVAFELRLAGQTPRTVALAGDFNGWDTRTLLMRREGNSELWRITIPLPPGRHVYSFVVDGREWVIDPQSPRIDSDELGAANVVLVQGADG
jgi:hypothetical protein